ncbi:TonB family protein [Flammeovirgaceae bacterium 311]|nr:TonB family protein [Flammeovirgaceae bacterium 311]
MLLFASCTNEGRERSDATYSNSRAGTDVTTTDTEYERTSNTNTAATYNTPDRTPMEAKGHTLSDNEFNEVRGELREVNQAIREVLRQHPGIVVRYSDNTRNADHNYGEYGVFYDNVTDNNARTQLRELETRRHQSLNQIRGRMNTETSAYIAAETDAAPKQGYEEIYRHITSKIAYTNDANAADLEGTMFVEFIVDSRGNVLNPRIVQSLDAGMESDANMENPARVTEQEKDVAIEDMEQQVIDAVKSTSGMWDPATMGGEPVSGEVVLPIHFQLQRIGSERE